MINAGVLYYFGKSNNWVFQDNHGNAFALHCGEGLELKINGRYVPCRLELADSWYVVFADGAFFLHRGVEYSARCY